MFPSDLYFIMDTKTLRKLNPDFYTKCDVRIHNLFDLNRVMLIKYFIFPLVAG